MVVVAATIVAHSGAVLSDISEDFSESLRFKLATRHRSNKLVIVWSMMLAVVQQYLLHI